MSRIEEDIKAYYGVEWVNGNREGSVLEHYGTKRHSGRYPWGSGDNPYQSSGDFLSRVTELKGSGKTEREVLDIINSELPKDYQLGTTEFRVAQRRAKHDRKQIQYDKIRSLQQDGKTATEIGREIGLNESTVRSILTSGVTERVGRAEEIAKTLKDEVDRKGMIDISEGAERVLGVTEGQLDEAAYILEAEYGYKRYGVGVKNTTNPRQQTNTTVLAKPEFNQKYAYQHQDEIQALGDYHFDSDTGVARKLQRPSSLDSSRVAVRYAEDGGIDKDGVIEIRRGVADLDLGKSHYAQVRILVDSTHYLKGMAVYSDDLPEGKDIVFNTNKHKDVPMIGSKDNTVLKPIKSDPDNPFGAAIKANGQSDYVGADGKRHLSPINKLKEEGDWDTMSRSVSSQFLSKQPAKLIENQLKLTVADYKEEYDEIMAYTNPTVKRKMLIDFADRCDGTAMTLKASAFPGQTSKVILPLTKIKDTEVYAPSYENGTKLALVRYPHAGTFEIPVVTVNNKIASARKNLGDVQDAIGISSHVAERLSGADFDGDSVTCIPISSKVNIKSTKPLRDLEGFDPKTEYAVPPGNPNHVKLMTKSDTQKEMGIISNLITDMTLRGAGEDELARAVKHSMVVIDAEKHGLDYKRSERENGIQELKQKWQIRVDDDGNEKYGGASTLLSRRKQTVRVPERKGSVRIDPETGEKIYKESGRTYIDPKTGKVKRAETEVSRISVTDDVRSLSSGTVQEDLYADFSNQLKTMANNARRESLRTGRLKYSPQAAKDYAEEVASIEKKMEAVTLNKPKERMAQRIANANVQAKIQSQGLDPKKDKKEIRKLRAVEIERARNSVSANGSATKITFTDREWEAVQAGAISDTKLTKILNSTKSDEIVKRAMPKASTQLSSAKLGKAQAMLAAGYTYQQIADALNVPKSTIYDNLKN